MLSLVLVFLLSCIVPFSYSQCASLVINSFSGTETTVLNALGQLSGDDGTTASTNIVNGALIIQTKPNVVGGWYTDIDASCKDLSAQKYDQVEVVWSNSSPSALVISVLYGSSASACQAREWTTSTGSSDSGVIGDANKTTIFPLTAPNITAALHTIYLGLPAQEATTTYSIRSIRLVQTIDCAKTTTKGATSDASLSLSFTLVLLLLAFVCNSIFL